MTDERSKDDLEGPAEVVRKTRSMSSFSLDSNESFPDFISDSDSNEDQVQPSSVPVGREIDWGSYLHFVPSLLSSPLGQAIDQRDAIRVRKLIDEDPTVTKLRDERGNNFLHLLAESELPNREYARDDWDEKLDAATTIAKLLVDHNVSIEAKNEDGLTPLVKSVTLPWIQGSSSIALIRAGANSSRSTRESPFTFLDRWIDMASEDCCHMDTYYDVLCAILQTIEDDQPANRIHRLIQSGTSDRFQMVVNCLLAEWHSEVATVDEINSEGLTPLFEALQGLPLAWSDFCPVDPFQWLMNTVKTLLAAGARVDFVTSKGRNIVDLAVSDHHRGWRTDEEDVELLALFLSTEAPQKSVATHFGLMDSTPTVVLNRAAFLGRPKTVEFLIKHGMLSRPIDDATFEYQAARYYGSLLDLAFFGAEQTRRAHIKNLDPEVFPHLYDADGSAEATDNFAYARISGLYSRTDSDRAIAIGKSRVAGYKEMLHLLQSHGCHRTPPRGPENEPTYFNAFALPGSGFFNPEAMIVPASRVREMCKDQANPKDEEWAFLYGLEILAPNWEAQALDRLVRNFTKRRLWPREGLFRRWSGLRERLGSKPAYMPVMNFLTVYYPPPEWNDWSEEDALGSDLEWETVTGSD
ncbi:hypothetical protein S40288_11170 [Stachybotrys chartarum IBT 40288]|nr:hypothetical protein S40288_11170 [Stachybotrys chartarum IBT 40288]